MREHERNIENYRRDLVKFLITQCNNNAREARENARVKDNKSNIKFYGYYTLMKRE